MQKEIKIITKELVRQGFEARRTSRGHLLVKRDGQVVGSIPGTPSDYRSIKNSLATLRRLGGFDYAH